MEKFIYKLIQLKDIESDEMYSLRYQLIDDILERSIDKRGVMNPVYVTSGERKHIVVGHKRFYVARRLGLNSIPAFEIQGNHSQEDLWMTSVVSNWNQQWSELDRCWALRKARLDFKFSDDFIFNEMMPALGLASSPHVLKEYLKVADLDSSLLQLISDGKMPFRGASQLTRLRSKDQRVFALQLAGKVSLTTNQLIKIGEWIYDLLRSSKLDLASWIEERGLGAVADHPDWDPRQKADKIFRTLRNLRFPRLTIVEERFDAISHELCHDSPELKVEPTPSFEDEGFWMHAKIKDAESLERILQALRKKRDLLNSLFDIML